MVETGAREALTEKIADMEARMADPHFWEDKDRAQELLKEYNDLKQNLRDLNPYDKGNAVLTIFAGAGGDDAEDFAAMLFNMYERYVARKKWSIRTLHENENDHGGYRNITAEIKGVGVYGTLKNESGVHRLVRISPFNAKKLRHTSFVMVEIIPEFTRVEDVEIPEGDISIEYAKSSGPGGQNVNKRETAVRIVHNATGLSVHCESERSQAQNREKALAILRGKLYRRLEDERVAKVENMYISKTTDAEWGNQIRSYVLHPYKMVKDHRTEVETHDVDAVLKEGELDEFISAEQTL